MQGLPGVGKVRAERLLAAFGTVGAVMAASDAELCGIAGVGAEIAGAIRWAVGEAPAAYGSTEYPA